MAKRLKLTLVILLSVGAFIALYVFTNTLCAFKAFTGLPCPACGTTRAFLAALRLDVIRALRLQPLAPALIITAGFSVWAKLFKSREFYKKYAEKALIALGGAYVIVYIIRMALCFPNIEPMEFNHSGIIPRIARAFM